MQQPTPLPEQTREDSDILSLQQSLDTATLAGSSTTAISFSSPRVDAVACDTIGVSPPSEAENAIDRHLDGRRDKNMCREKLSLMDLKIYRALYWPDGTRKKLSNYHAVKESRKQMCLLVQALLDKYNEDHNRLGDLAYELKDLVYFQSICEGSPHMWYYHLNFTTRTKGDDEFCSGMDNLIFAEVTRMRGAYKDFALSCFYMLKPNDNGHCYGCSNNGSVKLKHPNKDEEYTGGHMDAYLPYGETTIHHNGYDNNLDHEEEEARLQAKEEARVKRLYKCYGDPNFLEKIRKRFKDHPRAEQYFQLKKGENPQHTKPVVEDQGAVEE